ncbi:MAG: hypothetical protein AB2375_04180 [Tissierellaceae bacterium]
MKDFEKLDKLLRSALRSNDEPDDSLNQRIINKFKERDRMKYGNKKRFSTAAILTVLILATSISVFATWQLLTPKEIAENMEDKSLASAFQGEDAVTINETQISGDYKITLLGIVSGRDISDFKYSSNDVVKLDRTYAVVAIGKADGTPMPGLHDPEYDEMPFFASPFIKGQNPKDVNIITMNGGFSGFIEDGIWYRIVECDDIEIFADRGLYLGVISNTFYDIGAYNFNSETGEITRNEDYKGVNVLFDLPLNQEKANYEKAEEYLQKLLHRDSDEKESNYNGPMYDDVDVLLKQTALISESVKKLTPDKEGMINYEFNGFEINVPLETLFEDEHETGFSECFFVDERTIDDKQIIDFAVFSRDEDGTIKGMIYRKK